MADFKLFFPKIIKNEGFYSNDAADSGGETVYGLIRSSDKDWSGWKVVDNYKSKSGFPKNLENVKEELKEMAFPFYKKKYWDKIRGDEILSQEIAESICDFGINAGQSQSLKLAQRSLGLPETGKMDDITLNKLNNK